MKSLIFLFLFADFHTQDWPKLSELITDPDFKLVDVRKSGNDTEFVADAILEGNVVRVKGFIPRNGEGLVLSPVQRIKE